MKQRNIGSSLNYCIILIVAAVFCCAACSKSDNRSDPYYTIVPELRRIFNWRLGSYWIMRDSVSGQVDSFSVNLFQSPVPPYNYKHPDNLGVRIMGYPLPGIADTLETGFSLNPISENIYVFRDARKNINLSSRQILSAPFQPNLSNYIQNGTEYGNVYSVVLPMFKPYDTVSSAEIELVFNQERGLIRLADNIPGHARVWHVTRSSIK